MHPDPGQYWWVGVDTDRTLSLTGWIGETPEGDAAFLLLYPNAMGAAARMRQLADVLELRPGSEGAPAATHQASAAIDGEALELKFPGFATRIPVHAEYAEAARRGWGVLIVGQDGWDGRHGPGLDKYLSRQGYRRIHHGRIIISHILETGDKT